jgi:uncharacterized protein (DUF1330 family)
MPKGYWIARLTVHDEAAFRAYSARNAIPIGKHGGRFLSRGPVVQPGFGEARPFNVVVEFPSYEAAKTCFASAEYQEIAKDLLRGASVDLIVVEGYGGPQPGS